MKVRDHLSVPNSMRAVDRPKRKYTHITKHDPEGKRAKVLKFIRENSGQNFNVEDIANFTGLGISNAHQHVRKLKDEGRVSMKKSGFGSTSKVTYFYNEVPELLDRGSRDNGPVVVHPGEAPQPSVETETVDPAFEALEEAPAPRNASDAHFVMRSDMELFEYLRTRGIQISGKSLAFVVSDYSNYLHEKYLGEVAKEVK